VTMFLDAIANVQTYLAWPGIPLLLAGVLVGTIFGILPGLSGPQAIVLLLPLTIGLDLGQALVLLIATQAGTYFAGSLTSILVGIPGTPVNAATILDGHPLARQGKAGVAIGASGTASALGGILGACVLMLIIPFAQTLILSFSYEEFFAIGLFGISLISLIGGARIKGAIAISGFSTEEGKKSDLVTLLNETALLEVAKHKTLRVVERDKLDMILKEQEYALSDLMDTDKAITVGKLLTVHHILTGSVIEMPNSVVIFGRIINVETGEIESVAQVIVPKNREVKALL